MLASDKGSSSAAGPPAGAPRTLLAALYRLLPAIAMGVAAMAIVLTLVQALTTRGQPAVAASVPAVSPSVIGPTTVPSEQAAAAGSVPPPTEAPAPSPTPGLRSSAPPAAAPSSPPPPTATLLPPATLDVSPPSSGVVRVQGRILQPNDQEEYWFLIGEPGRDGVFRQGPAILNQDGSYVYSLSLVPLDTGPDSITLAAVPRDLSAAWLGQALSTRTWLPVVEVRPENGISFLTEVRL